MNSTTKQRKFIVVLVVLGSDEKRFRRFRQSGVVVCRDRDEIVATMKKVTQRSCWISFKREMTADLLRKMGTLPHRRRRMFGLLTIEAPPQRSIPGLGSYFKRLIGIAPDSTFLPVGELLDVLSAPQQEAAGLFISAVADTDSETLALTRGNLRTVTAPFSLFQPSGKGIQPDFGRLSLTDFGHTVRLGEYESSSDAILYEVDPSYRAKVKRQRLAEERTFGASLRRLRIQKGLSRTDFSPLAPKTIARIERGEVEKPHGETLGVIAERLGVEANEIESY